MWGPGGFSCFVRFVCHIPTGIAAFNALDTFKNLEGLGNIYDVLPHGEQFLKGSAFVGYAGVVTFAWNLLQFVASPFCRGYLLGLIGVVDLALAGSLLTGVVMQHGVLPGTYAACNGAANWNNATDGRNLFVIANGTDGFGSDGPASICHDMVEIWAITIVIIICYIPCGSVNMLFGFGDALDRGPGSKSSFRSPPQYDVTELFNWVMVAVRPMWRPFAYVYRRLYRPVYFNTRYLSKYLARNKNPDEPNRQSSKELPPSKLDKSDTDSEPSWNPNSLHLPMELVVMITQNLHHTDLVNLSKSSPALRRIFGYEGPKTMVEQLSPYVCSKDVHTTSCTLCRMPLCLGCLHTADILHSEPFLHLKHCRPACSKCFYAEHCQPPWQSTRSNHHHHHSTYDTTRREKRSLLVRLWRSLSTWRQRWRDASGGVVYLSNRQTVPAWQREGVCGNCARRAESAIRQGMSVVMDGDEWDYRGRLQLRGVEREKECCDCKRELAKEGVRWWVDTRTWRECRWEGHAGWVKGGTGG